MIKPISAIISGALLTAAMTAQAGGKTGGDDAYYIDNRGPVNNSVVVQWADAKAKVATPIMDHRNPAPVSRCIM